MAKASPLLYSCDRGRGCIQPRLFHKQLAPPAGTEGAEDITSYPNTPGEGVGGVWYSHNSEYTKHVKLHIARNYDNTRREVAMLAAAPGMPMTPDVTPLAVLPLRKERSRHETCSGQTGRCIHCSLSGVCQKDLLNRPCSA